MVLRSSIRVILHNNLRQTKERLLDVSPIHATKNRSFYDMHNIPTYGDGKIMIMKDSLIVTTTVTEIMQMQCQSVKVIEGEHKRSVHVNGSSAFITQSSYPQELRILNRLKQLLRFYSVLIPEPLYCVGHIENAHFAPGLFDERLDGKREVMCMVMLTDDEYETIETRFATSVKHLQHTSEQKDLFETNDIVDVFFQPLAQTKEQELLKDDKLIDSKPFSVAGTRILKDDCNTLTTDVSAPQYATVEEDEPSLCAFVRATLHRPPVSSAKPFYCLCAVEFMDCSWNYDGLETIDLA